MLQIARRRYDNLIGANLHRSDSIRPVFNVFDARTDQSPPVEAKDADGVISTLVLEHRSISIFFETIRKLLKKDVYLLLTNMHEEMGKRS